MAYRSNPLYLVNPTFITPEFADAESGFQNEWLSNHELSDNEKLYHYTNLEGMRGIIQQRNLRLGHVYTFNDTLELRYGKSVVLDVLDQVASLSTNENISTFFKILRRNVNMFGETMYHPFAACFCKSKNLLSQWRGYAHRGGGYCLGFQFSSLTRFKSDINQLNDATLPYLRRVFYERDEQEQLVLSYITGISQSVEPAIASRTVPAGLDLSLHLEMMAMRAVNLLFDMIITFKIDAFKEEDEWRFIRITTEGHEPEFLSFREESGSIVPSRPTYIYNSNGTDDYHFPLASIGFGPTLDATASKSSIQLYLNHIATDDHPIKLNPNISIIDPGYRLR